MKFLNLLIALLLTSSVGAQTNLGTITIGAGGGGGTADGNGIYTGSGSLITSSSVSLDGNTLDIIPGAIDGYAGYVDNYFRFYNNGFESRANDNTESGGLSNRITFDEWGGFKIQSIYDQTPDDGAYSSTSFNVFANGFRWRTSRTTTTGRNKAFSDIVYNGFENDMDQQPVPYFFSSNYASPTYTGQTVGMSYEAHEGIMIGATLEPWDWSTSIPPIFKGIHITELGYIILTGVIPTSNTGLEVGTIYQDGSGNLKIKQ